MVFRPDVEGLRAVAIVLVLICHAGIGAASGGYVGVDVFFVISGFVITRVLVSELDATGRLSLAGFYARRVKRLMPQALTVIAAVVLGAWLLLPPLMAEAVADDVMAAGAYAMNWRLSAAAVDYFAVAGDRPLDHFWSLAVEEQFYVVWPLLLLVLSWRRPPAARGRILLAVGVIAAASFAFAIGEVRASPGSAYFSPAARAWELALGGLVALAGRPLPRRVAFVAAWCGAAAILLATLRFGADTAVPGLPALLPTVGAAALIAAGASTVPAWPTRALCTRPARYVGRISYAWYIWHWPVLVFATQHGPRSTAAGVVATLVSVVPAIVTHRWIEEPLRRSRLHLRRPRLTLGVALACPAFAVACGIALSASIASPARLAADQVEGAAQLARTHTLQESATALRPTPREADADRGRSHADGCLVSERAETSPPCVYGDRRSGTTAVLFGDSHAMEFFPALERIARRRHWRLVQLTKAGCPPMPVRVFNPILHREYRECGPWREYALRRIERQERPALIVAGSSSYYGVIDGGRRTVGDAGARALAAAYGGVLRRLRATAPHVIVLSDPPRPPFDVPGCVSQSLSHLRRCAFAPDPALVRSRIVTAAVRRVPGVQAIDAAGRFCLPDVCPAVIGNVLVYRNSGHVTATFAETLAGWLGRRLPATTSRAAP
jgi:peptidoglycan/LPS O-acetylase OafA/YrhL